VGRAGALSNRSRGSAHGEPLYLGLANAHILQEQGVSRLSPCLSGGCGLRPNVKIRVAHGPF
jgi:hypothetical protein